METGPTTPTQAHGARGRSEPRPQADMTSVSRLGGLMEPPQPELVYDGVQTGAGSWRMKDGVLKWAHGPSFEEDGIRFRLWAPKEERIALVIDGRDPVAMDRKENGFHETLVKGLPAGARYMFALSSGQRVPDPASRFQPDDVDGPSEAIDPRSYHWREVVGRPRMARRRSLRTPRRRFLASRHVCGGRS